MKKIYLFILFLMMCNMPMLFPGATIRVTVVRPKDFIAPLDWVLPSNSTALEKLLEEVESGELEKKYSALEIDHINKYLAALSEKGISPKQMEEEGVLLSDINRLMGVKPIAFSDFSENVESATSELVWERSPSRFTRLRKKAWKFTKKHKKKIIAGAIVIGGVFAIKKHLDNVDEQGSDFTINTLSSGAMGAVVGASSVVPDKGSSSTSKTNKDFTATSKLKAEMAPPSNSLPPNHFIELPRASDTNDFSNPVLASPFENANLSVKIPESFPSVPQNQVLAPTFELQVEERPFSYEQKVDDLTLAIDKNPVNPWLYVDRGIAFMEAEKYDACLEDFHHFTECIEETTHNVEFSAPDFVCGFAKGFPKGVYDSREHTFLFVADFVKHPIHTGSQLYEAFTTLAGYVYQSEWEVIGKALSPELHQLLTEWETLPSDKRGELAGYCVGKNGTDLLTPAVIAKAANKSVTAGRALTDFTKKVKKAKKVLYLEAAAETGNIAAYSTAIKAGERTVFLGEELGISIKEMNHLKCAGKLESTLQDKLHHLSLPKQQAIDLYKNVRLQIKPFYGKNLSENQIRSLIHKTGLPTFPRPNDIPKNFKVMLSKKPGGMIYVHPNHNHTYIRVMPGKPHSPFPSQRRPYVVQVKDGDTLDLLGNVVLRQAPEAHIPLEEYIYTGVLN